MVDPHGIEHGRPDDGYRPLQLIGVIVVALLGFSIFFLSFLLAPLAILALFYLGFSSADRSKRSSGNGHDPAPPEPVAAPAPDDPAHTVSSRAPVRPGARPLYTAADLPERAGAAPGPAPAPAPSPPLL